MSANHREQLRNIRTFPSLIKYLREELEWPINIGDFEDPEEWFFEYTPEELGIDSATAAKIDYIKRLRPLSVHQPWGIFFVKFEPKRLPVGALRRILSRVVVKKRASANSAERVAWKEDDLLFISNYGEGEQRHISFAHFAQAGHKNNLPTLKVIDWDSLDTGLHLDHVEQLFKERLLWPENEADTDKWRDNWRSAFALRHREVITTSRDLSLRLAELARAICDRIKTVLAIESETGPLTQLMKAFQEALVHDLDIEGFADMYAQTIAYGLLSARITDPEGKTADDLTAHMRTNPFLRELMETFLHVGGRRGKAGGHGIDFDELGVSEVVDLLDDAKMEAVIRDFGDRNPQEDPVIHFYEHFLAAYDKEQKVQRGVFYTPRPVVSYIVRSVDDLLRTEFGLEDGLADTTSWGEMAKHHRDLEIPDGISPAQAFVQVLDPATGTGTFLVEVVDLIHKTMIGKWKSQGHSEKKILSRWNKYVPEHLLPRLHGYELLMAPYAIAHLKIGLKLYETGYRFGSDERARVYLTNALEPPSDKQLPLDFLPALAHEAQAVNEIKRKQRFTVVIGNPPYSSSISKPAWLIKLLEEWKRGLNETKIDLNREEWKFLRFAQHLCQVSESGIVGLIINRDFLDGITKRRMRENLGQTFPLRITIDLNGDVKGNITDENVFEIEQGVAIVVLCTRHDTPLLRFSSRVGTKAEKYADLIAKSVIDSDLIAVEPTPPYFRWVPLAKGTEETVGNEYYAWRPIHEVFEVYSSGIQTKRDALCVAFSKDEIWSRITRFNSLSAEVARQEFSLGNDGRDWSVVSAKTDIESSGPSKSFITPLQYRPFDIRFSYWTGRTKGFLAYPRREVMRHVVRQNNIGMIFNRQIVGDTVSHFGVSKFPICHGTFYLGNKGQDYFAPLMIFSEKLLSQDKISQSNYTDEFLSELHRMFGTGATGILSSEMIFNFIYAVFYSPTYRSRYSEYLKIDFPRLPIPKSPNLFRDLAHLGAKLVVLQLLESPKLNKFITNYTGPRYPEVGRVGWSDGTVWLDADKTSARDGHRATKPGTISFEGVPEAVWDFQIGGYQVCHKWLKDRKGRTLTKDDLIHYQKIIVALNETIRIMKEIDGVIEEHGGWPDAFVIADKGEGDNALSVAAERKSAYEKKDS